VSKQPPTPPDSTRLQDHRRVTERQNLENIPNSNDAGNEVSEKAAAKEFSLTKTMKKIPTKGTSTDEYTIGPLCSI